MKNREYWPTQAWSYAAPQELGMNPSALDALDPLIRARFANLDGIVIVRRGYIAWERYYHGCSPGEAHHMTSVTKSVVSALVGIAIEAGFIESIDQKVLDFFPEYDPGAGGGLKRAISLRHLLTMTAPYPFKNWHEPLDRMRRQPDWVAHALGLLGQGGEIGAFKYATAGVHLLSAILGRTTGQCARQFANERLFTPLGMRLIPENENQGFGPQDLFGDKVKGWPHDPQGNSTGGWGLTLTPIDMARFGYLYLNQGAWDGQQIVSQAWVSASTAMNAHKYGYLWWLAEEDGLSGYMALGDGGNMICVVPAKDVVVAVASHFSPHARNRWELVREGILPALVD